MSWSALVVRRQAARRRQHGCDKKREKSVLIDELIGSSPSRCRSQTACRICPESSAGSAKNIVRHEYESVYFRFS